MWKIQIWCLKPVSTSVTSGVTHGSVRVYACMNEDFELVIPHYEGKHNGNGALKRISPKLHSMIGEGKGSAMAGKVAEMAETAMKIPFIAPFASTVSTVARGVEGVLSMFGFTRTTAETIPQAMTMRSVTNVAHMDGSDAADSASLAYTNAISIDGRINGFSGLDPLANEALFSRWTLIKSQTFATTDAAGTVLMSVPVTPFYCRNAGETNKLHMTTAGFVGLPFEYWRGDMEYRLVTPISVLHRGTIQVTWIPMGSSITSVDPTNCSLNTVIDLEAGKDLLFSVGFAREIPFCKNAVITDDTTIVPYVDSCNGSFTVTVVNPLTAQTTTANTTMYLYCRAKQMEFAVPRMFIRALDAEGDPSNFSLWSQVVLEGAIGDDDNLTEEVLSLVPDGVSYPSAEILFGESFQSVRALMQKPSQLYVRTLGKGSKHIVPILFSAPAAGGFEWTWAGYYRSLFLGLAGSERFKIYPEEDSWLGACRTTGEGYQSASTQVDIGTLAPMTFCGPNRGAEFNIPYYQPLKFVQTNSYSGNFNEVPHGTLIYAINANTSTESETRVIMYYSFGPDIRATCFRQVPKVVFQAPPGWVAGGNWF